MYDVCHWLRSLDGMFQNDVVVLTPNRATTTMIGIYNLLVLLRSRVLGDGLPF